MRSELSGALDKLSDNFTTHTHSVFEEPTTTPSGGSGGQSAPVSGAGGTGTPAGVPSAPGPTGTPPGADTTTAPPPAKPAEAAAGARYRSHRHGVWGYGGKE